MLCLIGCFPACGCISLVGPSGPSHGTGCQALSPHTVSEPIILLCPHVPDPLTCPLLPDRRARGEAGCHACLAPHQPALQPAERRGARHRPTTHQVRHAYVSRGRPGAPTLGLPPHAHPARDGGHLAWRPRGGSPMGLCEAKLGGLGTGGLSSTRWEGAAVPGR